jgi:hypothetical protein
VGIPHPIYRVRSSQIVAPYTLRLQFDDHTEQVIHFEPVLAGELYRPLRNVALFNQVQIDRLSPCCRTVVGSARCWRSPTPGCTSHAHAKPWAWRPARDEHPSLTVNRIAMPR